MYAEHIGEKSIHKTQWPKADMSKVDERAEKEGNLLIAIITEIRREKAEKRKPLNAPIRLVKIYAGNNDYARILEENREDIAGTCKILRLEILPEKGNGRQVPQYPELSFISEYS
jgi:valyl-tRNA synthetase